MTIALPHVLSMSSRCRCTHFQCILSAVCTASQCALPPSVHCLPCLPHSAPSHTVHPSHVCMTASSHVCMTAPWPPWLSMFRYVHERREAERLDQLYQSARQKHDEAHSSCSTCFPDSLSVSVNELFPCTSMLDSTVFAVSKCALGHVHDILTQEHPQ